MSDPNQRKLFTKGETISFVVKNGMDVCTITGLRGICGTSVCYSAVRESADGRVQGTLTEFYPTDPIAGGDPPFFSMKRLPDGRLIPCGGTVRRYPSLVEAFQADFRKLCTLSKKDRTNVFRHIAEKGELLRGNPLYSAPESDLTTRQQIPAVYFWLPDASEMLLTDCLRDAGTTEEKLRHVLRLLKQAAGCIRTLHKAGLLHHSIRSDSFFVVQEENGQPALRMGVPYGLRTIGSTMPCGIPIQTSDAPELRQGIADVRTDVYAFGVLLFRSLVVHGKITDGNYDAAYYESLPQLIAHSGLITASGQHQNQALISVLSKLLKKSLAADPSKRYADFGKLLSDLQSALKLLENNAEKNGDVQSGTMKSADAGLLMKLVLHDHPIYAALQEKGAIRLAVVGAGKYTYAFLDNALQVCQMDGYPLYLTVFCDDPEEAKRQYVGTRQDLPRFAHILVGEPDDAPLKETQYGRICFTAWRKTGAAEEKKQTKSAGQPDSRHIASYLKKMQYHYGIADAGSSIQNRKLAEMLHEYMAYAGYLDHAASDAAEEKNVPVFRIPCNRELTSQEIPQELIRMAFNADILWNGNLNMDVQAKLQKFLSTPYHFSSSLAYAVSIRYKLFGLSIGAGTDADCAEAFSRLILADSGNVQKNRDYRRLVMYEHRRWIIEKVTDGWRAPRKADGSLDLETLVQNGMLKDSFLQLHPCIVPSSEETPLLAEEYAPGLKSRWNKADAGLYENEEEWDELDKVSVRMHRLFRMRAEEVRQSHPLNEGDVNKLQGLVAVAGHDDLRMAFQQYVFCLKNILNGATSHSRKYDTYHSRMEYAAEQLPAKRKAEVLSCLAGIRKQFFPVIESNLYRDRKANDNVLIDGIPFILTYQYHPVIAMPFQDAILYGDSNDALFQNVASASVLSPTQIHYLCCFTDLSRKGTIVRKLYGILSYLRNRESPTEVTITIVNRSHADMKSLESMLAGLKERHGQNDSHARFVGCQIVDAQNDTEAMDRFMEAIHTKKPDLYDGSTPLFQSPALNSRFVSRIMESDGPAYFEFDWRRKEFHDCGSRKAAYLQYIQDNSYISTDDMFALQQAKDKRFQFPEFMDDYETLWSIHTGVHLPKNDEQFQNGVECWNQLCAMLSSYDKQHSLLATLVSPDQEPDTEMLFYLPAFAFRTAADLLEQFRKLQLVSEDSHVTGHTSDTCCVRLTAEARNEVGFRQLFGQSVQYLQEYYAPYVVWHGTAYQVHYNNLEVREMEISGKSESQKRIRSLLDALTAANYIIPLPKEIRDEPDPEDAPKNEPVSFRYTSPRIKKLLTNAGMILELHTFFSVLKTGFFDEVITSYEFKWSESNTEVNNELDLILVRGFTTVFIECKSVTTLEQEYFHKLWSLSHRFGINTMNMVVANLYKKTDSTANSVQKDRAAQMDIRLLRKQNEIEHIAAAIIKAYKNHFGE